LWAGVAAALASLAEKPLCFYPSPPIAPVVGWRWFSRGALLPAIDRSHHITFPIRLIIA